LNQDQFAKAVGRAGGTFLPYTGNGAHYALVSILVQYGSGLNDFIKVSVQTENGQPDYGVVVRHDFGVMYERFPLFDEPVQFNLGGGSHYNEGDDPPDRITIQGGECDEVHLGNSSSIGFTHTEWHLVYRFVGAELPPKELPPDPPIDEEPPTGDEPRPITRADFDALADQVKALYRWIRDAP
jgi:hypothetical protein